MIRGPLEFAIGSRYVRSRTRNRFVSFISLISIIGIALAVAVLIVVLSVMNGFEYEVRNRILSIVSHAAIVGWDGRLSDWQLASDIAAAGANTEAVAPFVSGQGMLVSDMTIRGVEFRGVDPSAEARVSGLPSLLESGSLEKLESGRYRVLIGRSLAEMLAVDVGDSVIMMVAESVTTPAGLVPRMRRFEVAGIFYAGMYEYDRGLIYLHRDDAARLLRLGDSVSGVRIAMKDPLLAPTAVRRIARDLGQDVFITDWTRQHANFFRSIRLTKAIIFVILLMVVAVATFNVVSTLVMVVREKRADIAILRTLGSSPRAILAIFMTQGVLIGLTGTAIGVALGALLASNMDMIVAALERLLGFRFLEPDVYFISDFPSRISGSDVLRVAGIAILLAILSPIYPALSGARTQPAAALRQE
jgi:lipoprotein-releasing system permease protein